MNFEMVLATNNKHKLEEFREILCPHGIIVYGLNDLNLHPEEVIEDGEDYAMNAYKKAQAVAKLTSFPVMADDSGLEIEAMDGDPGLHTARFAKECGGYPEAFKKIFENIEGKSRKARFVCDIILLNMDEKGLLFEGIAEGEIGNAPQGEQGFGYDPIFISKDVNECFALLPSEIKNKVSHRGKALKKLLTFLIVNQSIK